jgi:hypothetical protein
MSGSSESSGDAKSVGSAGLGAIEKLWESEWALRLVFGVLLLDLALVMTEGRGVLTLSANMDVLTKNIGVVLSALAFTSFFAALVLPVLAAFVGGITRKVAYRLADLFDAPDLPTHHRSPGWVPAHELHKHALEEKSAFVLKIYEDDRAGRSKKDSHLHSLSLLVFSDLFLAAADVAWPLHAPESSTLLFAALQASGAFGYFFAMAVVIGACAILRAWWFPSFAPDVIYYPPLDAILRAREAEQAQRMREFTGAGRELARREPRDRAEVPKEWDPA